MAAPQETLTEHRLNRTGGAVSSVTAAIERLDPARYRDSSGKERSSRHRSRR